MFVESFHRTILCLWSVWPQTVTKKHKYSEQPQTKEYLSEKGVSVPIRCLSTSALCSTILTLHHHITVKCPNDIQQLQCPVNIVIPC